MSRNALLNQWIGAGFALGIFLALAGLTSAQTPDAPEINPHPDKSRVYIVTNPKSIETFQPVPGIVQGMVDRGITELTGKATTLEAWRSLVSTQDIIGIKVFSEPGPNSGTRPAVVSAVVQDLLAAGLPPNHIIVWDKHQSDLRLAGFYELNRRFGIRVTGSAEAGYDEKTSYDTSLLGKLVWGDFEFGKKGDGVGRKSFVSKLVTDEITKIINITPMMNHNQVGVAGNLFSLALGSVDNTTRFENDTSRLATAVPEIYALPALSDHVVLNIVDALICQYEGEERSLLQYSTPLNQLRFSRDPVALDVLSIKELDRQRALAKVPPVKATWNLYSNAGLLQLGEDDPKKLEVIEVP